MLLLMVPQKAPGTVTIVPVCAMQAGISDVWAAHEICVVCLLPDVCARLIRRSLLPHDVENAPSRLCGV